MTPKQKDIVDAIVNYIKQNSPVTLEQLQDRALSKSWYTAERFFSLLQEVHKDKRVKQTTKGDTIVYKLATARTAKPALVLPPYPYLEPCSFCSGTLCEHCFPFYDPECDTIKKIRERMRCRG